ncbi:MAG TPA: DUF362 domain-containing protein [Pirellulaceae bacterium]|jgi:uncharacterized protein (DUF362 family)|nr:DUF362 domain-containing protein [Pirellulaceae bacterium]
MTNSPSSVPPSSQPKPGTVDRRALLVGGGAAAAGLLAVGRIRSMQRTRSEVFIARNQRYDGPTSRTILDGLSAVGFDAAALRGKKVLLKPNLVEPNRDVPHMTTHPDLLAAAAEAFLSLGAQVAVGEGPGHMRDTEEAVSQSGLRERLDAMKLSFRDLNYEDVAWSKNRGRASSLDGFWFPRSVAEADLVVSMPKLKTHHWMGMTASMKNLYGVIPGCKYGWPKNVLHHHGIAETVFDINASLPKTIGIVDGIDCMEGDGPILGTKKAMGLILVGANLAALDATVARIMQLDPAKVPYLGYAADRLGPIDDDYIEQRGEAWRPLSSRFEIVAKPHLLAMRA